MACMSLCSGGTPKLLSPDESCDYLEDWFLACDGWIVGHNIAYDLAVIVRHRPSLASAVWTCYREGRVWDTGIHERLFALYHGWSLHPSIGKPIISNGVSLAQLAKGLLGLEIGDQKNDPRSIRYRYGELIGTHPRNWSEEARSYALEDARITYQIWEAQQRDLKGVQHENVGEPYASMHSFSLQVRAAWALHHLSAWGLRTDPTRVTEWKENLQKQRDDLCGELQEYGLLNDKLKKNMSAIRALVEHAYGPEAPRTEKGAIQTSADVLNDSESEILKKLARWMKIDKLKSTFGKTLEKASEYPINPRWNVLVRSGRTSCTTPNMQQLSNQGGVRECFTPRPGYVFIGADYSTAELVAVAQVCLNLGLKSRMAEAIRAGYDLHLDLASDLASINYEEAKKRYKVKDPHILKLRKFAKVPNFGLLGGQGAQGLMEFAKNSYGIVLTLEEAQDLKRAWFQKWPEMTQYFHQVKNDVRATYLIQHVTKRRRGG